MKESLVDSMEPNDMDALVTLKITRQLYKHAPAAIYTTIVNILLVTVVFRSTVNPLLCLGWSTICILYLLWRLYLVKAVVKSGITSHNSDRRLKLFAITVCVSGILIGAAGIIFLSSDRPAYNAFIFFMLGGMVAGSIGVLAINRLVFAMFAAPVILPVMFHSFFLGGEINTAMAVLGVIFSILMWVVVQRMNTSLAEAFRLEFKNKFLTRDARRLNRELKQANKKYKKLSLYDSLTKIRNRRFIYDELKTEVDRLPDSYENPSGSELSELESTNTVYGIFLIDIDHFKKVNDTHGHACGDQLLIQFVDTLETLVRKNDVFARWGGEEFLIVLKETTPEYLSIFADKVISTIEATRFKISDSETIQKTCSVGYVSYPFQRKTQSVLTLEQVIEIADKALYFAKNHGRNQAILATYRDDALRMDDEQAKELMQNLDEAIERGDIVLS